MFKSQSMNIATVGNCQSRALTWYIQQLSPDFVCKHIPAEKLFKLKSLDPTGSQLPFLNTVEESIDFLNEADILVYMHISPGYSLNWNYEKILKYINERCLPISISSFHWSPDPDLHHLYDGMIDRWKKFDIDIPAHKIIDEHVDEISIQSPTAYTHPNHKYYLELVRCICNKLDWNYYSHEQYNTISKYKWPNG